MEVVIEYRLQAATSPHRLPQITQPQIDLSVLSTPLGQNELQQVTPSKEGIPMKVFYRIRGVLQRFTNVVVVFLRLVLNLVRGVAAGAFTVTGAMLYAIIMHHDELGVVHCAPQDTVGPVSFSFMMLLAWFLSTLLLMQHQRLTVSAAEVWSANLPVPAAVIVSAVYTWRFLKSLTGSPEDSCNAAFLGFLPWFAAAGVVYFLGTAALSLVQKRFRKIETRVEKLLARLEAAIKEVPGKESCPYTRELQTCLAQLQRTKEWLRRSISCNSLNAARVADDQAAATLERISQHLKALCDAAAEGHRPAEPCKAWAAKWLEEFTKE